MMKDLELPPLPIPLFSLRMFSQFVSLIRVLRNHEMNLVSETLMILR